MSEMQFLSKMHCTMWAQGVMEIVSAEDSDIKIGEKIIISDVIPVMEGMPLKAIPATKYEEQLKRYAIGEPIPGNLSTSNNE